MLESRPAAWVKSTAWRVDGDAIVVDIETDPESGFQDHKDGTKVAIDVLAPKADAAAVAAAGEKGAKAPNAQSNAPLRGTVGSPPPSANTANAKAAPQTPSAELARDGAVLKFPGAQGHAVAVFSRGETLWIVLDNHPALDAATLLAPFTGLIAKADANQVSGASVLRLNFKALHLPSVSANETVMVSLSTSTATPPAAIALARQGAEDRMALTASLPGASRVLTLDDAEAGDRILVVPARTGKGTLTPKRFVELSILPSAAGLAVIPYADDVQATIKDETVRFARPQGLALSPGSGAAAEPAVQVADSKEGPSYLDFAQWSRPGSNAIDTIKTLRTAIARLPESESGRSRLQLARYLLASELAPEALGEISLMQADDERLDADTALQVMKAAAQFMMGRYRDARSTLSTASLASDAHAAMWRGMASAKLGDFGDARRELLVAQSVLHLYPALWQTRARLARAETGIAQGDLASAHEALDQLAPVLGPRETAEAQLMQAQLLAAQGHVNEAAARLRTLERAEFPPVAVKASYARIETELEAKTLKPAEAIETLEKLRYRWRGDDLELKILRKLGSMYFAEQKWREGLDVLRVAAVNFPGAELARDAQNDMRAAFSDLFLGGKTDSMPPIQALALFYDFIELTPIGREGDEMIRRLTGRLVTIDLLAPAAQLLEHQVYKRLDGVARSVVATQLATIYLLDGKPKEALRTINDTRLTRLPDEINSRRRLLEARALAGLKQFDAAVGLLADDTSQDAKRLRTDIAWESGNWSVAGARSEDMLGDRATTGGPLSAEERAQVMRAAVAYSLASDDAALQRLRTRFAAKMGDSPDARAFSVVTGKVDQQGVAFQDLAKSIASVDTLQGFMADLKKQGAPAPGAAAQN
jgi:tetratricopeptide (TPR) repeat protein